jgi:drug/metabolite transporter (DMT)-like permease
MSVPSLTPDRTTIAAFAGAVVIGGANFLAVKLSNEELEPLFGAAIRFAAAALLLFLLARLRRWPLPRGRAALGAALYGLLGFGFAYGFLYYALVGLSPGIASTITAAVPLVTLALAVAHGQERFTRRGVVGGLLAIAGIAVLSARAISGDVRPIYFLSAVLGVAAIAESTVVVKGFPRAHPFTTNAIGMTTGASFLGLASLLFREEWVVPRAGQTWVVLTWLVVAGSIGLFALFLYVVARWTASATVYALTVMPVVAVTLSLLFGEEELSIELILGALLVMSAVYIGALTRERPSPRPELAEAPGAVPESAPGG